MLENQDIKAGKNSAVISYFYLLGVLIAYLTNSDKKSCADQKPTKQNV